MIEREGQDELKEYIRAPQEGENQARVVLQRVALHALSFEGLISDQELIKTYKRKEGEAK